MPRREQPAGGSADEALPPKDLRPMLAASAYDLPADDGSHAFEMKWDGVRAIATVADDALLLQSRNGADISNRYPELAGMVPALSPHRGVLDGEVVALDGAGRPSFERLQRRMHVDNPPPALVGEVPVAFMAFDLLWLDGTLLLDAPYRQRRALLEGLDLRGPHWDTTASQTGGGADLFEACRALGLEGVLAKRVDSRYQPGVRSHAWQKIKHVAHASLVVGGFLTERSGAGVGSLLLGYHEPGARSVGTPLRYAGKVGSGITRADATSLAAQLGARALAGSPFADDLPPETRGARFTEPTLVADVAFAHWTSSRMLRHPRFRGLRDDIDPRDVTASTLFSGEPVPPQAGSRPGRTPAQMVEVEGRRLRLSNLDKVLYPETGFTKAMLVDYYARIAPHLLTHLRGRPLTLRRFPDGVEGPSFFEKHCPTHRPPWVKVAPVGGDAADRVIEYCLADDLPTLTWLANLAAIELHPSLSLAPAMPCPTSVVFDLDPGPGADIRECCTVALHLRDILVDLGLSSFPKTSGSKGLQLYVPLNTPVDYPATKAFAHALARLLERALPDLVTSKMAKRERPGKVLIDWSQNDRHKTTVAAYSVRAVARPMVSTPVTWEEVAASGQGAPVRSGPPVLAFDASATLSRVERFGDLFAPVADTEQALPRLPDPLLPGR